MWSLARLKIKQRMYVQFCVAVTPLVGLLLFQLLSVSDLPERVNRDLGRYRASNQAISSYREFLNGVTDAVDSGKLSQPALKALDAARQEAQAVDEAAPGPQLKATLAQLAKISSALQQRNTLETLLAARADINQADAALKQLAEDSEQHLAGLVREDAQAARQKNRILGTIAALTLVLLGFMVRQMVARITVPVAWAVTTAKRVASGDLSQIVAPGRRYDGIGELQAALREMNDSLIAIVTRVRAGSDLISRASDQIADGNAELSARTAEQASSLEATALAMGELTQTVLANAGNAQRANALAKSASDVAVKGGEVVGQVVQRMNAIDRSSRNIVEIIALIDGIAFQTNILALNAAVEAARAGDQGRGFAVVASEVRSLAQRSASSARQIKALIDDSVQQIRAGSELVGHAGQTMEQILASVRDVTAIMADIAATSQQQNSGIDQVNRAVTALNAVTRRNAALVDDAREAADALREQSARLVEAVGAFAMEQPGAAQAA
ncbi:methyl-accepting chemotaxis protein [Ramlibacter sp. G-1-2-2]|uniref:Methyl-accepting chemotaxis protein n=1 Tax=Ramlibacter agri TaxID=2728837 RepID=A0A848GU50_9BURK|nr:methyl-accepting chemotaxis protein [Ramlibacter agri]NML42145.1 methyl-accepting chemotaxis protein [Ramlibacter agri]